MFSKEKYLQINNQSMLEYLEHVPYEVLRETLYTVEELFDAFDPEDPQKLRDCYDVKVYCDYVSRGKDILCKDPMELWARNCHDIAILKAMEEMCSHFSSDKIVGIMGGHALLRTDPYFRKITLCAKELTEKGWLIMTGGGPGAMEASHLGAWLAGRTMDDVEECLQIMAQAPSFQSREWYRTAYLVRKNFPQTAGWESLAVPTWLYGHEPPAMFATHVAKLFSNCIREDKLIEIANGGLVFMPGSAGTLQEVFQTVEKNHYLAAGCPGPMIFVGKEHWLNKTPFYPVVKEMLGTGTLKNLVSALVDDVSDIIEILEDFQNMRPMIKARLQGKKLSRQQLSGCNNQGV